MNFSSNTSTQHTHSCFPGWRGRGGERFRRRAGGKTGRLAPWAEAWMKTTGHGDKSRYETLRRHWAGNVQQREKSRVVKVEGRCQTGRWGWAVNPLREWRGAGKPVGRRLQESRQEAMTAWTRAVGQEGETAVTWMPSDGWFSATCWWITRREWGRNHRWCLGSWPKHRLNGGATYETGCRVRNQFVRGRNQVTHFGGEGHYRGGG